MLTGFDDKNVHDAIRIAEFSGDDNLCDKLISVFECRWPLEHVIVLHRHRRRNSLADWLIAAQIRINEPQN